MLLPAEKSREFSSTIFQSPRAEQLWASWGWTCASTGKTKQSVDLATKRTAWDGWEEHGEEEPTFGLARQSYSGPKELTNQSPAPAAKAKPGRTHGSRHAEPMGEGWPASSAGKCLRLMTSSAMNCLMTSSAINWQLLHAEWMGSAYRWDFSTNRQVNLH